MARGGAESIAQAPLVAHGFGVTALAAAESNTRLTVVIPTFGRDQVLVATLKHLLELEPKGIEIMVIDQTPRHPLEVQDWLERAQLNGLIRYRRKTVPSIPEAMNSGALEAAGDLLLFLDDDIVPDEALLLAHLQAHAKVDAGLVAGRVLQPWHEPDHDSETFTQKSAEFRDEFMGGNFSIRRTELFALGGFDENFKGAAYHFEREFADRYRQAGGAIWYEPAALIHHLHCPSGGTRSRGDHLSSLNSRHPVGAYYYYFRSPRVKNRLGKALKRLFGSVLTRHHLRKPWYIPVTFLSELGGIIWAVRLRLAGPVLPLRPPPALQNTSHGT